MTGPYMLHLEEACFGMVRGVAAWMRSEVQPGLWAIVSEAGHVVRWAVVDDFGGLVPVEVPE